MEPKTIRPAAKKIQERFFLAVNECIQKKKIRSLRGFCMDYELHQPKYATLNKVHSEPGKVGAYKLIDIDAIYYIVKDCEVSLEWIMMGKGNMFKK